MVKVDARGQSRETLHERRRQVIALHKDGVPVMQIVERSGLSWSAVNAAIKLFQVEGELALRPAQRGRKQGTGRSLTEQQENEVRQFIRKKRPWYYGLKETLWSRVAVKQLIKQKCEVELSDRAVGNYLSRWGLQLKNATERPYARCSVEVRKWLDLHLAEIEHQARDDGAAIYWLNRPVAIDAAKWYPLTAPISPQQEALPDGSGRKKLWMTSVVTQQGKVLWAICSGSFGYAQRLRLLNALIRGSKNEALILILCDRKYYGNLQATDSILVNRKELKIFPSRRDLLQ